MSPAVRGAGAGGNERCCFREGGVEWGGRRRDNGHRGRGGPGRAAAEAVALAARRDLVRSVGGDPHLHEQAAEEASFRNELVHLAPASRTPPPQTQSCGKAAHQARCAAVPRVCGNLSTARIGADPRSTGRGAPPPCRQNQHPSSTLSLLETGKAAGPCSFCCRLA